MAASQIENFLPQTTCASFLARALLRSLGETLGNELYGCVLSQAGLDELNAGIADQDDESGFPLAKLEAIFGALKTVSGENSQSGVLQRSGRAWFLSLQRRSSPPLGIFTPDTLTLPKKLKIRRCGEILAEYFHHYIGLHFSVESGSDTLQWRFAIPHAYPYFCLGNGLANLWLGFWQELLYTLSGGKPHLLGLYQETQGDQLSWVIVIPYLPFEG